MLTSRSKLDFDSFFAFFCTLTNPPSKVALLIKGSPRAPRRRDAGSVRGNQRVD
jgi:hypothetical protein